MEIIGISGVNVAVGSSSRVPQAPSQPSTPLTGTVSPDTAEVRTIKRSQEAVSNTENLEQAVQESVEKLNEFVRPYVTSLQFLVDKDLGKVVVKIMDSETQDVIKQIPSEDVIALAKALGKVAGLLVKQEA